MGVDWFAAFFVSLGGGEGAAVWDGGTARRSWMDSLAQDIAEFRKAGYHTAQIGKWHTGTDTGFGRDWDYQIVWNRPGHPENAGNYYANQTLTFNGVDKKVGGYSTDNYTQWASERPFLDLPTPMGMSMAELSPSAFVPGIMASKVPMYHVGGWFDAFTRGTTELYATMAASMSRDGGGLDDDSCGISRANASTRPSPTSVTS